MSKEIERIEDSALKHLLGQQSGHHLLTVVFGAFQNMAREEGRKPVGSEVLSAFRKNMAREEDTLINDTWGSFSTETEIDGFSKEEEAVNLTDYFMEEVYPKFLDTCTE